MNFVNRIRRRIKRRFRRNRWISLCVIASLVAVIGLTISKMDRHGDTESTIDSVVAAVYVHDVNDDPDVIEDNRYIGIDEHGVLSLFEGPPIQDKVIRSFFQINIEYLESSLPPEIVDQLYNGIHVTTMSEYNSVLSTFSDYAIELSEEVMRSFRSYN